VACNISGDGGHNWGCNHRKVKSSRSLGSTCNRGRLTLTYGRSINCDEVGRLSLARKSSRTSIVFSLREKCLVFMTI